MNQLSLITVRESGTILGWLVSFGPIVYGVCKLKIRSLIVKKESLISSRASPPYLAMTGFFNGLNWGGPTRDMGSKSHPNPLKMAG